MEIVGAVARRIAAEEDLGAILLESVVKSVEDFGRHEVPRHEDIGSLERIRLQHHSAAEIEKEIRNCESEPEPDSEFGTGIEIERFGIGDSWGF